MSVKKSALMISALCCALLGLWPAVTYGVTPAKRTDKAQGAAAKNETFSVVQVGDEVQVIKKSELTNLKKTTADEDKRRRKQYDDAKKEAVKNKDHADPGKAPVKRLVKLLRSSFKTEQEATDWATDWKAKNGTDKAGTSKTGKSTNVY